MIKFFRNIRQRLISDNKFSKYLLYAIGEIILVVIGILIALQINNQNELRKQKLSEIEILQGIRNDILLDTIDLNGNLLIYKNFQKYDSLAINHLISKKKHNQWIANYLTEIVYVDLVLVLHNSHFEEAKTRGLSIISNNSLRNTISRLYEFDYEVLLLLENDTESFDTHKFLVPEFSQYFSLDSTGFTMSNKAYEKLISNGTSLYYYINSRRSRDFLVDLYNTTLTEALTVVDSIDKELKQLQK